MLWFSLLALLTAQNDPVAQLNRRIEDGTAHVRYDETRGYLPWVLEELGIPPESQMMVFSKTSVQAMRIDPSNPRRLYFNDSVIVGSVKGGALEFAAQNPDGGGMVFYLADQRRFQYEAFVAQGGSKSPIGRRSDCVTCHRSNETLIRSVSTARSGIPVLGAPVRDTDLRTPFEQLWGGWFVTGKTEARHSGNTIQEAGRTVHIEPPGSSDLVALMVFEHQMRVMNLIARLDVNELADTLLFTGEAPLPAPVEGTSGFAEKFAAKGPWDLKGRSLRDFDLKRRLMRYPCSYMVYSPAFEALPTSFRSAVYRRMREVLATCDEDDRRAVIEILRDTKADWPAS